MKMRKILFNLLILLGSPGASGDPSVNPAERIQHYIARAAEYVEAHDYALARTYLEPVLISPWITPEQRALAYTTQAFTYAAEGLYVSSALDYVRALEFDEDQTAALAALSYLYAQGLGVARNEDEALRLARKAAEGGHGYSRVYVATALLHTDIDAARRWLMKAAEDGYAPAYVHLANSFRATVADEPDPEEAKRWYETAAREGSVAAALALAYMYRDGELGEPDGRKPRADSRSSPRAVPRTQRRPWHTCICPATTWIGMSPGHSRCTARRPDRASRTRTPDSATCTRLARALTWTWRLPRPGIGEAPRKTIRRPSSGWQACCSSPRVRTAPRPRFTGSNVPRAVDTPAARTTPHGSSRRPGTTASATARLRCTWRNAPSPRTRVPGTLDTLAAAYAENGNYARAIDIQRRAIATISPETESLRAELVGRLAKYEAREPWRE